jgi:pimeloyl-ACP methyl ester carboxylesterase
VLDELAIDRAHLVLHDFGGPWGLRWAAEHPDRFASAILLNTGTLPGYRWHALARVWRAPIAGELFMATTTRPGFRLLLRRGQPRPLPRPFVDRMYDDFDRHTRRSVLALYRSVPDVGNAGHELAAALRPLDRPATVIWGRHDPYLRLKQAEREREAFPHAEMLVLDNAGHWPFVDQPEAVADGLARHLARHAGTGRDLGCDLGAPDLLPTT